MRKLLLNFVVIFVLMNLTDCNTNKRENEYGHIDLVNGLKKKEFFSLSKIAEEIEYIFLETNDNCLVADIHRIVYDPPYFFITDRFQKAVFIFYETGKYVNKISAVGQGPHEYTEIYSFDAKDSMIYILDYNMRKIFKYDVKGKFYNALRVEERPSFIKIINENEILIASKNNAIELNNWFVFSQYDKDFKLKRKFHPMKHNGSEVVSQVHSFYRQKDTLVYWEWNIFDTVYNVLPEGRTEARYIIDPGKIPSSLNQSYEKSHLVEYNQFDISNLIETDKYIFLYCVYQRKSTPLIYNKNENRLIGIEMYLENDIDGGKPFWPKYKLNDNKVCTASFPDDIKRYLNMPIADYNKGFNYVSYRPKVDYDEEKHKKLLEQLEKTDDMSNPVLMIVTMKSDSNREE